MTPCVQLAAPTLGCQPWREIPLGTCRLVLNHVLWEEALGKPPSCCHGLAFLRRLGAFGECNAVPSLGLLCNGCPIGDARGGGTLELPAPCVQEQTARCTAVTPKLRQDARLVSALLSAPPPPLSLSPMNTVVTGPAKGKGRPCSLPGLLDQQ